MLPSAKEKKGFTLIELMIVISIVAILSAVGVATYSGVTGKTRDSVRKRDLTQLGLALELYLQKNNKYVDGPETCTGESNRSFYAVITPFMSSSVTPKDPKTGDDYCYESNADGSTYKLVATLDDGTNYILNSEDDLAAGGSTGGGGSGGGGSATVPGLPQNVSATAGNRTFTLFWAAPAVDGGGGTLTYIITYGITGGSINTDPTNSCCSYTGPNNLTNGTQYTVTVAAKNSVGTGEAISRTVTPTTPPAACTDECPHENNTRCSNGGFGTEVCRRQGSCLKWSNYTACHNNDSCYDGVCEPTTGNRVPVRIKVVADTNNKPNPYPQRSYISGGCWNGSVCHTFGGHDPNLIYDEHGPDDGSEESCSNISSCDNATNNQPSFYTDLPSPANTGVPDVQISASCEYYDFQTGQTSNGGENDFTNTDGIVKLPVYYPWTGPNHKGTIRCRYSITPPAGYTVSYSTCQWWLVHYSGSSSYRQSPPQRIVKEGTNSCGPVYAAIGSGNTWVHYRYINYDDFDAAADNFSAVFVLKPN